jgi:hypothetical protein
MTTPPKARAPRTAAAILFACLAAAAVLAGGCSGGLTQVREVHYYAVPSERNTNYYRLRVHADTALGETEYRSGWFPTRAVDNLFGEVTSEGGVEALKTRTALEEAYNKAVEDTTTAWLTAAADPTASPGDLEALMNARRRILAYPLSEGSPFGSDTVEVEYNPMLGLVRRHADEKLVFVLSSNPDEVIQNISNFAESEETAVAVSRLAEVVSAGVVGDIAADEAREQVDREKTDKLIAARLAAAIDATKSPDTTRDAALGEIDTTLDLINAVRP